MRITFVAYPGGKPWNGATLYNEPLGGSEAAVGYMARAFARLGHAVTVWSHGESTVTDGVLYQNLGHGITVRGDADVLVVSRWTEMLKQLQTNPHCLRILWLHDMPQGFSGEVPAHAVFPISEFQARAWQLVGRNIYVTADGVDLDIFRPVPFEGRDINSLVWVSNPDRGLPVAAHIFQQLRQRWPDLQLHVYGRSAVYGWGSEAEMPYLPQPEYMENITLHDPLPRPALGPVLGKVWAMFYPTWWPETFCMAALEAQDRKSTRLNSSHIQKSRMPSSA